MIEILKQYFTKDGKPIVVLEYKSGMYLCSYGNGKKEFLDKKDIIENLPKKVLTPEYEEQYLFNEAEIAPIIIPETTVEEIKPVEKKKIEQDFDIKENDFYTGL